MFLVQAASCPTGQVRPPRLQFPAVNHGPKVSSGKEQKYTTRMLRADLSVVTKSRAVPLRLSQDVTRPCPAPPHRMCAPLRLSLVESVVMALLTCVQVTLILLNDGPRAQAQ